MWGRRGHAARWISAVTVGVLLTGLAACSSTDDAGGAPGTLAPAGEEFGRELLDEGDPVEGGQLVIGVPAETDGWHPTKNNWTNEGHLVGSTFIEPLMAYDTDGEIQYWLAESLEPSEDLMTWTVTVKPGILFHDGTELDAAAVKQNLDGALFEGLASIAFTGAVDSVDVVGDRSVAITFTRPYAVVPQILAGVPGLMAAPSMLDDPDGSSFPIGTGPFRFQEWVRDSYLDVVKWDSYWRTDDQGRSLPYLDGIRFRVLLDPLSREQALDAGEIDMMVTTSPATIEAARSDASVVSVEDNWSEETFVMLNTGASPFDDIDARKALAYGTDVDAIVDISQLGIAQRATGPFAPGTAWETQDPGWIEYDPAQAQASLDAYTQRSGEPLRFTFSGVPVAEVTELQQQLAQQWAALGIEAEITTLDQIPYITGVATGTYEAAWFRNYGFTDPLYLYVFFHSQFANGVGDISTNFSQVRNPELDALLEEGLLTGDDDERREIYEEAVQLINEEFADIWLFHTPWALIARPEVRGLNHPRQTGFASIEPKVWMGGLWLADG